MSDSVHTIVIENCNNVSSATLNVAEGELTVVFGANGMGKSTIARAVAAQAGVAGESLEDLMPYEGGLAPSVSGVSGDGKVAVFNEGYVSTTLFQDNDHLINDAYHVFVATDGYAKALAETKSLFDEAKSRLEDEGDLSELMSVLEGVIACYGRSKDGFSKSSSLGKSVGSQGNAVDNVPQEHAHYKPLIQGDHAKEWVQWRGKGSSFESGGICPYCARPWDPEEASEGKAMQDFYGGKYIDHCATVLAAFGHANECFNKETNAKVAKALSSPLGVGPSPEAKSLLSTIRGEAEGLRDKLRMVGQLDFGALRRVDKVKEYVEGCRIQLGLFSLINSDYVTEKAEAINGVIADLLAQIKEVSKRIGVQNTQLKKAVAESKAQMDGFLDAAGFPYEVEIESPDGSECIARLKPRGLDASVSEPQRHLSYGERNALAIALFAAQVRRDRPSLVVLDDPISSFDQNKKYAIVHHLLAKKDGACKDVTTLMLTHDPETLTMLLKVHAHKLVPCTAYFLENRAGRVALKELSADYLEPIVASLGRRAALPVALPARIACARQLLELEGDKGAAWSYLSCLVHRKHSPDEPDGRGDFVPLGVDAVAAAEDGLAELGMTGGYDALLGQLSDAELFKPFDGGTSPFERVCAFRVLCSSDEDGKMRAAADRAGVSPAVFEFASEFFHVENLMAYCLDPIAYGTVPQSVADAVDSIVGEYRKGAGEGSASTA